MTCAKLWLDWFVGIKIRANMIFQRVQLWVFVKWFHVISTRLWADTLEKNQQYLQSSVQHYELTLLKKINNIYSHQYNIMSWHSWKKSTIFTVISTTLWADTLEKNQQYLRGNSTEVVNTLRLRHNGCHFQTTFSNVFFLNENIWISTKISLNFVPEGVINSIPALVQIMAWRCSGDKPLSEPMMVSLLTYIYAFLDAMT